MATPGSGFARAQIKNAVDFLIVKKPPHNFQAILDIDKVAHLAAVEVFLLIGFEKPHFPGFSDLVKSLEDHACHVFFVVFIGTENIEKFDTRNFIFQFIF